MSLNLNTPDFGRTGPLELAEAVLDALGWPCEAAEDDVLQTAAPTRWGDMALMLTHRPDPAALHVSLTLDVKPMQAKRAAIADLILLANERLWLGHFDYWSEESVIVFRHTLPLAGRDDVAPAEFEAVFAAAISAADRFLPAFNFLIWAGKSPRDALEAALFDTDGEA